MSMNLVTINVVLLLFVLDLTSHSHDIMVYQDASFDHATLVLLGVTVM